MRDETLQEIATRVIQFFDAMWGNSGGAPNPPGLNLAQPYADCSRLLVEVWRLRALLTKAGIGDEA